MARTQSITFYGISYCEQVIEKCFQFIDLLLSTQVKMTKSDENLVSDIEFQLLVDAFRELDNDLKSIVEVVSPWLELEGIEISSIQNLARLEIVELAAVVADIDCADDDVLASFLLFLLKADWSDDYQSLRKSLEEATQPGMTEVFSSDDGDEEEHFLSWESRIRRLTNPSVFMEMTVIQLDRILVAFDLKAQFIDLYLGAVAKFSMATFRSTVLSEDNVKSLIRAATFCSSRLQMKDLIYEIDLDDELMDFFQFDSSRIDTFETLQTCIGFGARFDESIFDSYSRIVSAVIEIVERSLDEDNAEVMSEETFEPESVVRSRTAQSRLQELLDLRDSGLISQDEYENQRSRIIEGI